MQTNIGLLPNFFSQIVANILEKYTNSNTFKKKHEIKINRMNIFPS